jgi:ornithine cyclodeaminase/alanine dehydrogenase-like protein (mu-crystallin family)
VRVWSRTHDNAKAFAAEIGAKACDTVEEAVRDADIICTATASRTPLLKSEWVKAGAHINGRIISGSFCCNIL